jgi:hypothetical protein
METPIGGISMTDLPDTVVGSMTGDELWNSIEAQVKEWRAACCDEEGKDLLAFLQGKQLDRFLSLAQHRLGDNGPMRTVALNRHIGGAQTMDALVANLAHALARKTRQLEEIKEICKEDY